MKNKNEKLVSALRNATNNNNTNRNAKQNKKEKRACFSSVPFIDTTTSNAQNFLVGALQYVKVIDETATKTIQVKQAREGYALDVVVNQKRNASGNALQVVSAITIPRMLMINENETHYEWQIDGATVAPKVSLGRGATEKKVKITKVSSVVNGYLVINIESVAGHNGSENILRAKCSFSVTGESGTFAHVLRDIETVARTCSKDCDVMEIDGYIGRIENVNGALVVRTPNNSVMTQRVFATFINKIAQRVMDSLADTETNGAKFKLVRDTIGHNALHVAKHNHHESVSDWQDTETKHAKFSIKESARELMALLNATPAKKATPKKVATKKATTKKATPAKKATTKKVATKKATK